MEEAKPISTNLQEDLSFYEVLRYFKSPEPSTAPPIKPKAGELYLITWKDDSCKSKCMSIMSGKYKLGIIIMKCMSSALAIIIIIYR